MGINTRQKPLKVVDGKILEGTEIIGSRYEDGSYHYLDGRHMNLVSKRKCIPVTKMAPLKNQKKARTIETSKPCPNHSIRNLVLVVVLLAGAVLAAYVLGSVALPGSQNSDYYNHTPAPFKGLSDTKVIISADPPE